MYMYPVQMLLHKIPSPLQEKDGEMHLTCLEFIDVIDIFLER